jgi:predicted nucleic acid-binding Zn ribbon protein
MYGCKKGHEQEEVHGMTVTPVIKCATCGKVCKKLLKPGYIGLVDKFFPGNNHEDYGSGRH